MDTRGERNNNPLNLEDIGIPWEGLANPPSDEAGYCRFVSSLMGLRAGARDLYESWRLDGLQTIEKLVYHFAPPSENDTEAYIVDVATRTGIARDTVLELGEPPTLANLVTAFVWHENGKCSYDPALILQACTMALG